jgi:glycosyltransferase involved in cell wall biosynthesis
MIDQSGGASLPRNGHFSVSVIIPTRDRPTDLHHCLQAIAQSSRTGVLEVIVVDDASRQWVLPTLKLNGIAVRVIRNAERQGAATSRNAAAVVAVGDALAFLDDDARITSDWFQVVQRELSGERGAITGRVLGFDQCVVARARQRRFDQRYRGLATGDPVEFLAGGNSVVWSDAFRRAGGFPALHVASDNALLSRMHGIGLRCHFVHELMIGHRNSKGLRAAVVNAFQAGALSKALASPARSRGDVATPLDPNQRDIGVEALNWFLNLSFKAGRATSCMPVLRGAISRREWGLE